MNLSVLQSIYKNDNPLFLDMALKSISEQTLKPIEIILIKDGKLSEELDAVIEKWINILPIKLVGYETNQGLAHALNYGLQYVSAELVARMDSDDICYPERFEKQVNYFISNPDTEILGAGLTEFYEGTDGSVFNRLRLYPTVVDKNSNCLFKGTPLGHPTLMVKASLLKEFRYNENTSMNEDIDLWFRFIKSGHVIHNVQEPLINFRITDGTFKRRSIKKAVNEFHIYNRNLKKLFGINWRLIYPIARLVSRFLPYTLNKKLYFSKSREKLLNTNGEL